MDAFIVTYRCSKIVTITIHHLVDISSEFEKDAQKPFTVQWRIPRQRANRGRPQSQAHQYEAIQYATHGFKVTARASSTQMLRGLGFNHLYGLPSRRVAVTEGRFVIRAASSWTIHSTAVSDDAIHSIYSVNRKHSFRVHHCGQTQDCGFMGFNELNRQGYATLRRYLGCYLHDLGGHGYFGASNLHGCFHRSQPPIRYCHNSQHSLWASSIQVVNGQCSRKA